MWKCFSLKLDFYNKNQPTNNLKLRNFKLSQTSILYLIRLSSFILPPQTKFGGYIGIILSVCLSVCLSRVNLTLAITFSLKEIRLSYYSCVFLVQELSLSTKKLTSWPWPWHLHTFEKNLTLDITLNQKRCGFHIACVYCLWQDISLDTKILTYTWRKRPFYMSSGNVIMRSDSYIA